MTEDFVAEVFGTKFVRTGGVVNTTPTSPFVTEWGVLTEQVEAVDPNQHTLWVKEKRDKVYRLISKFLDSTKTKIPVIKSKWSHGRITGFDVDKSKTKFWKRLRRELTLSEKKNSLLFNIVKHFLNKFPQYSSTFEQDVLESKRIKSDERAKVIAERKRKQMENKIRKQHAEHKVKLSKEPKTKRKILRGIRTQTNKQGLVLTCKTKEELLVDGKMPWLAEVDFLRQLLTHLVKAPVYKARDKSASEYGDKLVEYISSHTKKKKVLENLHLLAVQEQPVDFKWSEIKSNTFDVRHSGEISGVRNAQQWFRQALITSAYSNTSLYLRNKEDYYVQGARVFNTKLFNGWVSKEDNL